MSEPECGPAAWSVVHGALFQSVPAGDRSLPAAWWCSTCTCIHGQKTEAIWSTPAAWLIIVGLAAVEWWWRRRRGFA
jgi:hypothetical protein